MNESENKEKIEAQVEVVKESEVSQTVSPTNEVADVVIKPKEEHVCDENCKHEKEEKEEIPPLTYKEGRALKRSRYSEIANKFNTAYVLKNTKTGQIVEIRAASSFHACNLIGWKPNRVVVMSQSVIATNTDKEIKREDTVAETTSHSS